jgi:hypothetical protein
MAIHGNDFCGHTDAVIEGVKVLQDGDKPHEVLAEIQRLRSDGTQLTGFHRVILVTHELGALFALGRITAAEFVEQINALTAELLKQGGDHALADVRLWCVMRVVAAGELELARDLVAQFFDSIVDTPATRIYGDMASVFLYAADGDTEAALQLCHDCLSRIDRAEYPCTFEMVSLDFARLLLRDGKPTAARAVLYDSGMPPQRVRDELARLA